MNKDKQKGFTLIELLVVIAILATLAVAVTLILNPAELIQQGRDSTRLNDMSAIQSAISLYLADVSSAGIGGADDASCSSATARMTNTDATDPFTASVTQSTSTSVDGTGWVLVDFENVSSGAPLSNLPLDPTNTGSGDTGTFYGYACDGTNFELNTNMESTRYSNGGDDDVESDDGGNDNDVYELGNDPDLDL